MDPWGPCGPEKRVLPGPVQRPQSSRINGEARVVGLRLYGTSVSSYKPTLGEVRAFSVSARLF